MLHVWLVTHYYLNKFRQASGYWIYVQSAVGDISTRDGWVSVCVCVSVYECVCVCVCVWERERESTGLVLGVRGYDCCSSPATSNTFSVNITYWAIERVAWFDLHELWLATQPHSSKPIIHLTRPSCRIRHIMPCPSTPLLWHRCMYK